MKAQEIAEILSLIEEYRPAVLEGIRILKSYGPEVKQLSMDISVGFADVRTATFNRYLENGFSREEALYLMVNDLKGVSENMKSMKVNK